MKTKPTKTIFCANEQEETTHDLAIESNGELAATCSSCDRVLKFSTTDPVEFEEMVERHLEGNRGQLTVEATDRLLEEVAE